MSQIWRIIMCFRIFENINKHYLAKARFFSFSILFTKYLYHLPILWHWTLSRYHFVSFILLPFPDSNVLYSCSELSKKNFYSISKKNYSLRYQKYQKCEKLFLEEKYVSKNTRQNKCRLFYTTCRRLLHSRTV